MRYVTSKVKTTLISTVFRPNGMFFLLSCKTSHALLLSPNFSSSADSHMLSQSRKEFGTQPLSASDSWGLIGLCAPVYRLSFLLQGASSGQADSGLNAPLAALVSQAGYVRDGQWTVWAQDLEGCRCRCIESTATHSDRDKQHKKEERWSQ